MEKVKRHEFEGEVIEVPVYWDDHLQREAESYEGYYNGPVYTTAVRPILLTIEDACPQAEMVDNDPASIDCGSCRHYHQFPGSLLGVCNNEQRKKTGRSRGSGPNPGTKEESPCEND